MVHVILRSFVVLTWMHYKRGLVKHVSLWNTKSGYCNYDNNHNDDNVMRTSLWLNSMVVYFNVRKPMIYGRETWQQRSEFWTENICSLGFQDIRARVIIRRLITLSLKCSEEPIMCYDVPAIGCDCSCLSYTILLKYNSIPFNIRSWCGQEIVAYGFSLVDSHKQSMSSMSR